MPNHNEIWAQQGIAWDLRLLIDLIKKLPIFGQLELIDQVGNGDIFKLYNFLALFGEQFHGCYRNAAHVFLCS